MMIKKILLSVFLVGVIGIVGLIIVMAIAGRDIPEPDVSDLMPERTEIAPDQNAYTYFIAATNSLYWPTNKILVVDYLDGKSADKSVIQDIITRNDETLRLLDEGIARGACITPEVTGFDTMLPYLTPWRNMGRLLALKTRHARHSRNFKQATGTCISLLRFGNLIQRDAGCLINYLVGLSVLDLGLTQAQDLARDEGLSGADLKRLSEILDALDPLARGLIKAIKVEYKVADKTIEEFAQGKYGLNELFYLGEGNPKPILKGNHIPGYFFQPNRTKRAFADFYRNVISNASQPYGDMSCDMDIFAREMEAHLETSGATLLMRPNAVGKILCALITPALRSVLERKCRTESGVNATRIIAALNAHQKREGVMPADLQALVPEYLPSVPVDPFDGKPMRYSAANGIVYSVGSDLMDSGGSTNLPAGETCSDPAKQRWEAEDAVFELHSPSVKSE
ncbi:MAG: hypothetical protein AB7T27_05960 [Kiritimatiellia bacterium]